MWYDLYKLMSILKAFPSVSRLWLLFGEGDILSEKSERSKKVEVSKISDKPPLGVKFGHIPVRMGVPFSRFRV